MCGYCGARQARGAPMLEFRFPTARGVLYRCAACAGGHVPDLPPLVVEPRQQTSGDFAHVAAAAPREWLPYRDEEG